MAVRLRVDCMTTDNLLFQQGPTACRVQALQIYNLPSTLFSSGVMVAHLIPTLHFLIASAASTVTEEQNADHTECKQFAYSTL